MNERAQIYNIMLERSEQGYKDATLEQILTDMESDDFLRTPYDDDIADVVAMARRLRELTRWIPVEERLPTKEDADWNGLVAWWHQVMYGGVSIHPWDESPEWHGKNIRTHWKRIENF